MANKQLALTETASGGTIYLNEGSFIMALEEGTGSKVYKKSPFDAERKEIIVDEAPAAITALGTNLIDLTERDGTAAISLSALRILSQKDDAASKSLLTYNSEGMLPKLLEVDETTAAIIAVTAVL